MRRKKRPDNTTVFSLRLPPALKAALEKKARREYRKLGPYIRLVLLRAARKQLSSHP